MTIQELYDVLGQFIKNHPEYKDKKIMLEDLKGKKGKLKVENDIIKQIKKINEINCAVIHDDEPWNDVLD